jgi:HAD superfamily hydrolase (TIGR01509 family)
MIEVLLFDLGGVVIDIDFERIFHKWSQHSGVAFEKIRAGFRHDHIFEQHERGEIGSVEFYRQVSEKIEMDLSFEQFREGWNDIMIEPIAQTVDLLERLADKLPLYALSNTNPMHVEFLEINYADELKHFRQIFVSSDLGHRKPEQNAYLHVARVLDLKPGNIAFFDDLASNVEAARKLGMQAVQVKTPADVAHFVAANKLLS